MASFWDKLFGGQVPYTSEQSNIGNLLTQMGQNFSSTGAGAFGAGQAGVTGAAQGAAATSAGITGAAVPGVENVAGTLQQLGGNAAGAGIPGVTGASGTLSAAGTGALGTGFGMLDEARTTETTGMLPPGARAQVDQNTNDAINTIKGKFAALGMSGSTEEATAIANAQQQGLVNQFNLAAQLGGLEGQQALGLLGQGFSGVSGAGGLSATLASLGIGAYGQAGGLLSALSGLGFNYANLSSNDWNAIASQGLQAMGLGSNDISQGGNVFSTLAGQQMTEDQAVSKTIQSFFTAMGGSMGQSFEPGALNGR